jgi:2'-5' RNA ligase superfamily
MPPEDAGAPASLVVPVPVADWLVKDRGTLPAHVPLLGSVVRRPALTEGFLAELEMLFADVVPFSFDLDEVCAFPSGEVYLAPHPPTPFRQLTAELARRFPTLPSSAGQFPDVVPHVSVPLRDGEALTDIERRVRGHGPLRGLATEAQLVVGPDVLADFPFGTAAA